MIVRPGVCRVLSGELHDVGIRGVGRFRAVRGDDGDDIADSTIAYICVGTAGKSSFAEQWNERSVTAPLQDPEGALPQPIPDMVIRGWRNASRAHPVKHHGDYGCYRPMSVPICLIHLDDTGGDHGMGPTVVVAGRSIEVSISWFRVREEEAWHRQ